MEISFVKFNNMVKLGKVIKMKRILFYICFFNIIPMNSFAYTCTVSVSDIIFGLYDPASGVPLRTTGSVTVSCMPDPGDRGPAKTTMSIGPSLNSGLVTTRQMLEPNTGDLLSYNIYTDNTYTVVLGDGTGGSQIVKKNVTQKKPWNAVLYCEIPTGQFLSAGVYDDVITIDVLW